MGISTASTLPSAAYFRADWFQKEQERLFGQSWQSVACAYQLKSPGDFVATNFAEEPLLLLRDRKGTLRAFSNVCRHRASALLQGTGNTRVVQCPYHAWTYDLEGRLQGAPEFEGVENWQREKVCLPEFAVAEWGPFVMVNLSPRPQPFGEYVGDIPSEIESAGYPFSRYQFLTRTEYVIECNWKVYVDNYLEGYHIPTVHPALHKELDYKGYRVETRAFHSRQFAPLRARSASQSDRRYDPEKEKRHPLYYWLFPNLMLNIYPDNLHNTIVMPMGPEKTLTIFEWFTAPEATASLEETISFSDQVQKEDIRICEQVQRGLKSHTYDRGRYSVKRENGVYHFHQLWERALES